MEQGKPAFASGDGHGDYPPAAQQRPHPGRRCRALPPWTLGICAALLHVAAHAEAPAANAPAAGDLSFEQLSAMEVSGVSKAAERSLDAPAAVTIIGSEELRAFGFRTLAEVLTLAPGYFAYDDRAYGYVGVGGLAPIGGDNARVLLLIDGFPTNDNVFEQALLGNEAIIDLALIDRIEIIRGPSSSVYGANAFFGVINVILKTPAQLDTGAEVSLGSNAERIAAASASGSTADLRYLLRLTESSSDGQDVVFGPQPGLAGGGRFSGVDGNNVARVFSKIIDGNLRVNLGFSERRQRAGYGLHGDVLGDPSTWVRDGDTFADLRYEGSIDSSTDYSLRFSAAQYRYDAEIADDPTAPNTIVAQGDWIDSEATATHRFSAANRLVVGAQLRRDLHQELSQANRLLGTFQDVHLDADRLGVYVQSDVDWTEHWSSSVGLRGDRNDDSSRVNPRMALLYKPDRQQVIKLVTGNAFREASVFEGNFAQPGSFIANPRLTPERIRTVDLDYEAQIDAGTRTTLSLFRYRALDLISQTLLDPVTGTTQFQNVATARSQGVDFSLEKAIGKTLQLRLSGSYARATDGNGIPLQNSPHWSGRLGAQQQVVDDWRLGAEALYVDSRLALDNSPIPAYVVANLNVSTPPRRGRLYYAVGLYNAFDRTYSQPLTGLPRVDEPGRTWRATLGYAF